MQNKNQVFTIHRYVYGKDVVFYFIIAFVVSVLHSIDIKLSSQAQAQLR